MNRLRLSTLLFGAACVSPVDTQDTGFAPELTLDSGNAALLCLQDVMNFSDTAGSLLFSDKSVGPEGATFESPTGPTDNHHDLGLFGIPDGDVEGIFELNFNWTNSGNRDLVVVTDWNVSLNVRELEIVGIFNDCQNAAAWLNCPEVPTANGSLSGCNVVSELNVEVGS